MADKEVYFDNVLVGYATKATMKEEVSTDEVATFSGKVVDSDPNPSVTVSIESVRAGTINQYIELAKKVKYAKSNKITVQLIAKDKGKDGIITTKEFAYGCLISNKEAEVNAASRTAEKLELKGEAYKQIINGQEI